MIGKGMTESNYSSAEHSPAKFQSTSSRRGASAARHRSGCGVNQSATVRARQKRRRRDAPASAKASAWQAAGASHDDLRSSRKPGQPQRGEIFVDTSK